MKRIYSRIGVMFLLCLFFASNLYSGVSEVEVTAEGTGATEDLATRNALANAVGKASGVSVTADSTVNSSVARISSNRNDTNLTVSLTNQRSSQLASKGQVKSWHKISSSQIDNGIYRVKIAATVYTYERDASSNRKKVALFPVVNRYSDSNSGKSAAADLERAIENYLVQSRRFAVLTRADMDKVLAEQGIIGSDLTAIAEKAKLGNMLGGDVLLLPIINKVYFTVKERHIQVTGQTERNYYGEANVTLKVVSAVTGELKFSETYSISTASKNGSVNKLLDEVAGRAVKDLVMRIYPPRVIRVTGNHVYLNAGGKGVRVGEVFTIYREGEAMIDPYTGESLGGDEEKIGSVKVTRVESKFAVATAFEGTGFEEGMIAKSTGIEKTYANRTADVPPPTPKESTGYKLPFDR